MNSSETTAAIDLSYLEMMADGDDAMKRTLLEMIVAEMPPELEKLRAAFLARDAEALRSVAHKMKSTLAFVGNDAMTEANAALEQIGKDAADLRRAAGPLDALERHAAAVLPALAAESAKLG